MRVVFVIPYFYPAWQYGGSPRAAFAYAKALTQRGHQVTVLTTDSMGKERSSTAESEPVQVEGIEVYYYRNLSNRLAFQQRLFWPPRLFRDLPLRIKGADVIHIHELRASLSVAAFHTSISAGIPYVVSPHGGLRRIGKAIPKMIYDQFWGNRILQSASAVIVLSASEEKDARDLQVSSDCIFRLPNSTSLESNVASPAKGSFRKQWKTGDRRIIGFLGRLHRVKGVDILLRAFSRLIRIEDNLHLVIAGPDDGEEKELRRLAEAEGCARNTTFTGFLDGQAKMQFFADADLLVIPSRSEAFPVTVLEALLSDLPVLLSDSCDLTRTLTPEHGVESFHSEDINDLTRKMQVILASDALRSGVSVGRALVQREYSMDRVGSELERLYSSIVGKEVSA